MKHINLFTFCSLFILALISGCGKEEEPEAPYSYADVEAAFQEIVLTPGTQDLTLKISETINYNFRVIVPDVDLTQKTPLIFALHFAANGDPNVHMETDCYVEPGLEDLDAIIISPNGGETVWGTTDNQDKIRNLVNLSTKFWPIDLDKIAVMGYSSGGNGTWFFTETQPHIFSAGIAIASGYNTLRPNGTARTIANPLYVIHGEDDDFFNVDTVGYWVDQTIQAGSNVEYVVAPNLGHYTPCAYVPYIKTAALWLKEDIWEL